MKELKPLQDKEITEILFKLGSRKLVLVEGDTDLEVLEDFWFKDVKDRIMFRSCKGSANVIEDMKKIKHSLETEKLYGIIDRIYGIIDRDFREDSEVGVFENLLVLSFFTLENYLLHPKAIWEEMRVGLGAKEFALDEDSMMKILLDICKKLAPVSAANWIIWEELKKEKWKEKQAKYLSGEYPQEPVDYLSKNFDLPKEEVQSRLNSRLQTIQTLLDGWEKAYSKINGKHIIAKIRREFKFSSTNDDHLRRLLARTVYQKSLIGSDLQNFIMHIAQT